ncbi:MAG: glycosyltransferase family 2 protein [Bulleidia sp.]
MTLLNMFTMFTEIIFTLIMFIYGYQFLYVLYSMIHRRVKPLPETDQVNRFAVMISARNEAGVIYELLDSLAKQEYPKDHMDIYVVADNCTDDTAEVARQHGAIVYERFNQNQVGKGYALNFLYRRIIERMGHDYYDGYVVFDADNLVDPHFLEQVNRKWATGKYDALTTYRNTKNFGTSWLSAAYSIWFMHEARHLNYVRDSIGAQCMISGTGFVVSEKVMKANQGWPFYFLTEDIQFSVDSTINGYRIGYVDSAILYDEQPFTMKQSWNQRLRWAKGLYQIDAKYLGILGKGLLFAKGRRKVAFYDVMMICLPCSLLTFGLLGLGVFILLASFGMPYYVRLLFCRELFLFLWYLIAGTWQTMMITAALTVISEWDRIPADNFVKVKYIVTFPLYILTYIPISIQALCTKVTWKPIRHYSTTQIAAQRGRTLNY